MSIVIVIFFILLYFFPIIILYMNPFIVLFFALGQTSLFEFNKAIFSLIFSLLNENQ